MLESNGTVFIVDSDCPVHGIDVHFRRIATRFDKLARNFLAAVVLAATRLRTRAYESTT
jgi:hypothetical protein